MSHASPITRVDYPDQVFTATVLLHQLYQLLRSTTLIIGWQLQQTGFHRLAKDKSTRSGFNDAVSRSTATSASLGQRNRGEQVWKSD